jgi:hypothetical protein
VAVELASDSEAVTVSDADSLSVTEAETVSDSEAVTLVWVLDADPEGNESETTEFVTRVVNTVRVTVDPVTVWVGSKDVRPEEVVWVEEGEEEAASELEELGSAVSEVLGTGEASAGAMITPARIETAERLKRMFDYFLKFSCVLSNSGKE